MTQTPQIAQGSDRRLDAALYFVQVVLHNLVVVEIPVFRSAVR